MSEKQKFKVKAEIRYDVDVGVFEASSEEEAKTMAQELPRYSWIAAHHKGGVYDLNARPLEKGHNPLCGCGWCK